MSPCLHINILQKLPSGQNVPSSQKVLYQLNLPQTSNSGIGLITKQAEGNKSSISNISDYQHIFIYSLRTKVLCALTDNNLVLQ